MTDPGGIPVKKSFFKRHRWTFVSSFLCALLLVGVYTLSDGSMPVSLISGGIWFAFARIVMWFLMWVVFFDNFTHRMIVKWTDTRTADVVRTERFRILLWLLFAELALLTVAFTSSSMY